VTGLGRPDRRLDRLQVPHLAHEDHVRVLAQHAAERLGEAGHVHADLALVDDRLLVVVVVLDRILDGDDVPVEVHVDVVDHRRQGGGLARAGRPGDDEQPAGPANEFTADRRQPDLLEGQQLVGNEPQGDRDIAALAEDGHAEAGLGPVGKSEVTAALFLELLLGPLGGDGLHQGHAVVGVEDLGVQVPQRAVETQRGLAPGAQVQVGRALANDGVEQPIDLDG
jgi:hypothetical protein